MSVLSLRLPDKLLEEMKSSSKILHISPTEYMRMALTRMNEMVLAKQRAEKLKAASLRARKESMIVNSEFSAIENDMDE